MKKSITMPKNWKKGPLGVFQHPFCRKAPKFEVGTFWGKFFPLKSIPMPKKPKGGPLVSSGIVCYAENLFGSVPWANGYNLASS